MSGPTYAETVALLGIEVGVVKGRLFKARGRQKTSPGLPGREDEGMLIRDARSDDVRALWDLAKVSPEESRFWKLRMLGASEPVDVRLWPQRHPGERGLVVVDPSFDGLAGSLFYTPLLVKVDGALTPGVYLDRWRVHPSFRRRGVGSALLARAQEEALGQGAELIWAAVLGGNRPSLAAFKRNGYRLTCGVRVFTMLVRSGATVRRAGLELRHATAGDLAEIAGLLNVFYAEHNFWEPTSVESLYERSSRYSTHPLDDLWIARSNDSVAVAGLYRGSRALRMRFAELPPLVGALAHLLSLTGLVPDITRPFGVDYIRDVCYEGPDGVRLACDLIAHLVARAYPEAQFVALLADESGPLAPVLALLRGLRGRLDLVVKAPLVLQESRPSFFGVA